MVRRKKGEAKAAKTSTAVRKSSRQIARKQQEVKKPDVNELESDIQEQDLNAINHGQTEGNEDSPPEKEPSSSIQISEDMAKNLPNWIEEETIVEETIVEETIICEEMEIDADIMGIAESNSNSSCAHNNKDSKSDCDTIEQGVSNLCVNEVKLENVVDFESERISEKLNCESRKQRKSLEMDSNSETIVEGVAPSISTATEQLVINFEGVLSQKESPKKTLVEESVEIFTDPPKKQMPDEKKSEDSESSNENSMASSSGKTTTDEDKSKSQADDTDSASNGSGVRRSSRIRTIGLMKQRTRGRGLVNKANLDPSKLAAQNALNSSTDVRTVSLNHQDATDKDSIGKIDSSPSLLLQKGSSSEDSRPVKVKSRWRRSSELEMGESAFSSFYDGNVEMKHIEQPATIKEEAGEYDEFAESSEAAVKRTGFVDIIKPENDEELKERLSQFEHLKENLYLTDRYTNKETKRMTCDCFLTEDEFERGELGCGEDCLNRLLMIECGQRCVVGDRCTNRRFQRSQYSKCEVFRTEKKGFGLRACSDIEPGEFIMEYVGEVLDPLDFRRRAKDYSKDKNRHYYFMALKSDQIIDATMKGNISRFINHSCDPNSETQKWTVNGELRIGFFNKKFVSAGEEITFDYHFQRYGKEAQRCYCESSNCRGWIGETPEEEKEKLEKLREKEEKREKERESKDTTVSRKKKEEKKIVEEVMKDEDLEEEIDKLTQSGLKNRSHTLTLSRLMVRSRALEHRTRLLRVIQSGEQPCRRLFLDYHGLRLIWSYIMDVASDASEEADQFRLDILKTLSVLPIPNKTMLIDSKVLEVVQKWTEDLHLSPPSDSPEDDQTKVIKTEEPESTAVAEQTPVEGETAEKMEKIETDVKKKDDEPIKKEDEQTQRETKNSIYSMASNLILEWSNLKEVFRIPKKERIEQMKEHEREADRGYKDDMEKDELSTAYDRSRYLRGEPDKRDRERRRGRESPDSDKYKDKKDERGGNLLQVPRMSKYERRQLFALKVAKEEEERHRRQQQELWQEHQVNCASLGVDPHLTPLVDPQTGYHLFYNASMGQWTYSVREEPEIPQQCPPMCMPHPMQAVHPQPIAPQLTPMGISGEMPCGITPEVLYPINQTPTYCPTPNSYPAPFPHPQEFVAEQQTPTPAEPVVPAEEQSQIEEEAPISIDVPPIDLPPKWKSAKDARGRTYYYHVQDRVSQWLPPRPDHLIGQVDSSSSSESSDDSSSSNEDDDENSDKETEGKDVEMSSDGGLELQLAGENTALLLPEEQPVVVEPKKKRDGLVQERIISPRREEDRVDHKKYKDVKGRLLRQKEKMKLKEGHSEKPKKPRRNVKSKSHPKHAVTKMQITSAVSTEAERKIKDAFRLSMANVMVHFLNPYRKNDCKQGRITNTEDFKHLARKLTHFVLAKELRHCKSIDELQCNENVKHKAKDFVRKYMSKFGPVYSKSTDDD